MPQGRGLRGGVSLKSDLTDYFATESHFLRFRTNEYHHLPSCVVKHLNAKRMRATNQRAPLSHCRDSIFHGPHLPRRAPLGPSLYTHRNRHMHISIPRRFHTTRRLPRGPTGPSEWMNHLNTTKYLHNRRVETIRPRECP
jgi:hypothetical protein